MSALAEALVAAQRTFLSAYSKRFVAGEASGDLDGEEEGFRGDLDSVGLTDKLDQGYLLECLRGLRHMGVTAPAATQKANGGETEKASDKQLALIVSLCERKNVLAPDPDALTKAQASEIIDSLDNGTYDPSKWTIPF